MNSYRGRIAPSITGFLHRGHAVTFYRAFMRAKKNAGKLVYRAEDLDRNRYSREYEESAMYDLKALSIEWDEGPDKGGPYFPYKQSERLEIYKSVFRKLLNTGLIYLCNKSRKEIKNAKLKFKHGEYVYPEEFRPAKIENYGNFRESYLYENWRFRLPLGRKVTFNDIKQHEQCFETLNDFGDFLVWRKDGLPSYELAVVVDDHLMNITEVVRGKDLLLSTARQILLYEVLEYRIPFFYHTDLILDENGNKLSKRNHSTTIRDLLKNGMKPEELLFQVQE